MNLDNPDFKAGFQKAMSLTADLLIVNRDKSCGDFMRDNLMPGMDYKDLPYAIFTCSGGCDRELMVCKEVSNNSLLARTICIDCYVKQYDPNYSKKYYTNKSDQK